MKFRTPSRASSPDTGTMAQGSLGPRKDLDRKQLLRKVLQRQSDEEYVEPARSKWVRSRSC